MVNTYSEMDIATNKNKRVNEMTNQTTKFSSFNEFYPFYLKEHSNTVCRRLHFVGSTLVLLILAYVIISADIRFAIALPIVGYGFAWIGHFFYEKNKPATFKYPLYSFIGDWVMYKDILTKRIPW